MQEDVSYSTGKKRVTGRVLITFVIVMLLLTFLSNTLNNFLSPRVITEKPESGQLVKETYGTGKVRAKHIMDIYAQSQMKVLKVMVNVGDRVKKGQQLMVLDTSEIEQQLYTEKIILQQKRLNLHKLEANIPYEKADSYESAVETAEINVKNARQKYEDSRALFSMGAESKAAVNETKTAYDKAELELKKAQSDYQSAVNDQKGKRESAEADKQNTLLEIQLQEKKIEKLEKQMNMSSLAAQVEGTVIELNFLAGAVADSSKPLYRLADVSKGFEFVTTIDKEEAKELSNGDTAEVSLESRRGFSAEGRIGRIIDNQQELGSKKDVIVDIPSDNLVGGESGSITIRRQTKPYDILVSNSSLGQDASGYFVFILKQKKGPLGEEFVIQKASVLTGQSDNAKTGITGGLNSSDRVVISSDKPLSEGMRVIAAETD